VVAVVVVVEAGALSQTPRVVQHTRTDLPHTQTTTRHGAAAR